MRQVSLFTFLLNILGYNCLEMLILALFDALNVQKMM